GSCVSNSAAVPASAARRDAPRGAISAPRGAAARATSWHIRCSPTAVMLGLVLTAGGARGAYQAGVLKRLGEIPALADGPSPFAIVTGASAGAINGAMLAAGGATFREATSEVARLWSELRVEQVFRTDLLTLGLGAAGLLRDLALGGLFGTTVTSSFIDAAPLRTLIARILPKG